MRAASPAVICRYRNDRIFRCEKQALPDRYRLPAKRQPCNGAVFCRIPAGRGCTGCGVRPSCSAVWNDRYLLRKPVWPAFFRKVQKTAWHPKPDEPTKTIYRPVCACPFLQASVRACQLQAKNGRIVSWHPKERPVRQQWNRNRLRVLSKAAAGTSACANTVA